MKGSIVKKGRRWWVTIEAARNPITGVRVRQYVSGHDTKKEAESARIEIVSQIQNGVYTKPINITLKDFLIEWIESAESRYKPGTHSVLKRHLTNHIINHIGNVKLKDLRTLHLNKLYKELAKSGNRMNEKGLSPRTIRNVHAYLRKALSDAEKWDYLQKNPAANAELPKDFSIQTRGHKIWTQSELQTFLRKSEDANDKYYPLWFFLATTGVRRGEALGLEWKDIDLVEGLCTIRQTLGCVNHLPIVQTPKTPSSCRTIALPAETVTALKRQKKYQAINKIANPGLWNNDVDFVFTHEDGRMLHPEYVLTEFHRRSERYGVPRINIHSLRHGWATFAGMISTPPNVMKEHLGHSSITITMDIYSHVLESQDREAAESVAKAMFSAC